MSSLVVSSSSAPNDDAVVQRGEEEDGEYVTGALRLIELGSSSNIGSGDDGATNSNEQQQVAFFTAHAFDDLLLMFVRKELGDGRFQLSAGDLHIGEPRGSEISDEVLTVHVQQTSAVFFGRAFNVESSLSKSDAML